MFENLLEAQETKMITLPVVPHDRRPAFVYHDGKLDVHDAVDKGWTPVDVRLMPKRTDQEKCDVVKAWLEGMRFGTVDVDTKRLRAIELEARVLGMIRGHASEVKDLDDDAVNALLARGSKV
jgi:hypothetical protein